MYSNNVQFMQNDVTIKDAIRNKAGRYGKLGKPYIVCINATGSIGIEDYEIDNALLGSLAIEYNLNAYSNERWVRIKDGFFYGPQGPEYTQVSAVFITNVHPANYLTAEYRLFLHPFAAFPLETQNLKLSIKYIQENQIHSQHGKSFEEVFRIQQGNPILVSKPCFCRTKTNFHIEPSLCLRLIKTLPTYLSCQINNLSTFTFAS